MVWPPAVMPVTARELVRRLVDAGVPEVNHRVFEGDMPPAGTETPFIVIRFGNDSLITGWGAVGTPVYVWAFVGMQDVISSYRLLDQLNSEVVTALTPNGSSVWIDEATALGQPVSQQPGILGSRYLLEYQGVSVQDTRDETLEAIARPVEFILAATNFRKQDHVALVELAYAFGQMMPVAQTDPTTAHPTAAAPFVYSRFSQPPLPVEQVTLDAWWMEGMVNVHVITPDPLSRIDRLIDLGQALQPNTTEGWHVIHDAAGQNPIQLALVRGDASADAFQDGQMTLRLRYIEVDPSGWPQPGEVPVDHIQLTSPMKVSEPIP